MTSTKLDFDDYKELGTVMIERYDGDGVNDAPGSPLIKYWSLGGGEMNRGVSQGVPVEDRIWPLTEAQTAEYVKIGYDLIQELHPEFRARIDGPTDINSWQQGGDDYYYYNLISELTDNNKCNDLIFDYHQGSNAHMFKSQIEFMGIVDLTLNEFGYNGNEIWTTDIGGSWEEFQGFTEIEHAGDVVRRYTYTIANGQEKLFWTRIEEYDWTPDDSSIFDYMGLVHNPANNGGEDWKKLSYYTYKLMVERLEGSNWDNIQTIQESDDIYIYKFIKKDSSEPVWVAWWDYFEDTGCSKTITLDVGNINSVKIIEAVPNAESGDDLNENDYPDFFKTGTKAVNDGKITISLGESPVFIEEILLPIAVTIKKPKDGKIYLMNKEVSSINSDNAIVIGKITVEAGVYGENGIEKVEFYIDGVLKSSDSEQPYGWTWNEFAVGNHEIKVIAYDNEGNEAKDNINVIIFNIGG